MQKMIPISDLTAPELEVFTKLAEPQLMHYYEPDPGLLIAESPKVILRALDAGYTPVSLLIEEGKYDGEIACVLSRCEEIPVYTAPQSMLGQLTGFYLTRGAWCAMRRKTLPSAEELCHGATRIAILENIMNPTNIGAIFRSAAALNLDAVLLTPGCSDPLYRRAARVSMGTVFQIPWTYLTSDGGDWTEQGMPMLKSLGFSTAAMALKEDSVPIDHKSLMQEEKLAIILGSEGEGLSERTIRSSDYTVLIPMAHGVDSLNVAAASAVAFWQLGKR